jgi:hypothetical protein
VAAAVIGVGEAAVVVVVEVTEAAAVVVVVEVTEAAAGDAPGNQSTACSRK